MMEELLDNEELLDKDYRVSSETFTRLKQFMKQRLCCMGGNHEKGGGRKVTFPTVGFCDDKGVSRSLVGWKQDEQMTLWFLRTQQDAFVVAACGVIEIIFVRETTLPRLLNRLDELSLWQIDKAHEVALAKLLVGTDVWKAEGCCVSVNSLVVAHSCEDGKHLESAKRCPKQNRNRNRP